VDGLVEAGLRVLDCGRVPTPLAYFEAAEKSAAGICVVTASHNPAAYNGLNWMINGRPPLPPDMDRVRANAGKGLTRRLRGSVAEIDPAPRYRRWMESRWQGLDGGGFGPIILDAGNGAWSLLGPEILRGLGFRVTGLFCEFDGRFPNRPPIAPAPRIWLRSARPSELGALASESPGTATATAWPSLTKTVFMRAPMKFRFCWRARFCAGRRPGGRTVCMESLSPVRPVPVLPFGTSWLAFRRLRDLLMTAQVQSRRQPGRCPNSDCLNLGAQSTRSKECVNFSRGDPQLACYGRSVRPYRTHLDI
jgi:hypothetical protein